MIRPNALKRLLIFQLLSPFAIGFVVKTFQLPAEVAGALFISVGLVVLASFFMQMNSATSALFICTLLYLFVSIFLFGGILSHLGQELSSYNFLYIPAKWIHHLSEVMYLAMMVLTVFEFFKAKKIGAIETELAAKTQKVVVESCYENGH